MDIGISIGLRLDTLWGNLKLPTECVKINQKPRDKQPFLFDPACESVNFCLESRLMRDTYMGNVVDLKPLGETLEFGGRAAAKRDQLLCRLLQALRQLQALFGRNARPDQTQELDTIQKKIEDAQQEYATELARIELMADVCDTAHKLSPELSLVLPDGEPSIMTASCDKTKCLVKLSVVRRGARFFCDDFQVFEPTAGRLAALFRQAS
ncbi:MAG: hypothetical protein K2Y05_11160 [Hyphomicrobiaceae bacterium]|nr:hypothetical protein [Hyphomicrobiaceae bacterium]